MSNNNNHANHFERSYGDEKVNGVESKKSATVLSEEVAGTEFSIRDFLDILLKGKWSILSSFSIVFVAVAVYTFMQSPEYESTSILMVDTQRSQKQSIEEMLTGGANRNVYNEVEILKSRRLANTVAERLIGMQFTSSGSPLAVLGDVEVKSPTVRDIAERLMGTYVKIRPVSKDVDMIRVIVTSTDPEEAELIANLYSEAYLENNRVQSREQMRRSREFLEGQVQKLEDDIGRIEEDVEAFQNAAGAYSLQDEAAVLLKQVSDLEIKRDEAEVQLNVAVASLRALEDRANRAEPSLMRTLTSGVQRKIQMFQEKVALVDAEVEDYYARNPSLRGNEAGSTELAKLVAQRDEYQKQVDNYTAQYLEDVRNAGGIDPTAGGDVNPIAYLSELRSEIAEKSIEVTGAETALSSISSRLQQKRAVLSRIPSRTIREAQLNRSLESRAEVYGLVAGKFQESRIAEESEIGYATIIDDAVEPRSPVRPNVALNLILGSLFGLILGMCIVFLRNAMDNRIRKPEDLRRFGVSVLGVVPDMAKVVKDDFEGRDRIFGDGRSYSTSLIALLNPLSPVSETYRRLRTNIQFSRPDSNVQVIMVTSSGPGEGKTVTAANLAITMAQAGRPTLYIDADLRRPTGHKMLGLSREPGLVELLFDKHPFDLEGFATGIDDLYAIPAGSSVPNPAELMGSKKMRDLIFRLREEFDYIIIDTPPVLAVTDSVLLSTQSDATVVVISANETDFHSLGRTVDALRAVDAPLAGTVLNRFNVKRAYGYYGYRYSYGYGYGYGYKYGYDYYGESSRSNKKEGLFSNGNNSGKEKGSRFNKSEA